MHISLSHESHIHGYFDGDVSSDASKVTKELRLVWPLSIGA